MFADGGDDDRVSEGSGDSAQPVSSYGTPGSLPGNARCPRKMLLANVPEPLTGHIAL